MNRPIGTMGGTYFVSRSELLSWVNQLLGTDHKKVEELCSGATYCRIFNTLFPKSLPLKKVNFNAKLPYEYHKNYKLLQVGFDKMKVGKKIEIERLTAGKYQDNLEFLQWFKSFFDQNHLQASMNHVETPFVRRRTGKKRKNNPSVNTQQNKSNKRRKTSRGESPSSKVIVKATKEIPSLPNDNIQQDNSLVPPPPPPTLHLQQQQQQELLVPPPPPPPPQNNNNEEVNQVKLDIPQFDSSVDNIPEENRKLAEMKISIDSLERERDFYFGKLRDIELLCQENEENPFATKVSKILYETDKMDEFSSGSEDESEEEEEEDKEKMEK